MSYRSSYQGIKCLSIAGRPLPVLSHHQQAISTLSFLHPNFTFKTLPILVFLQKSLSFATLAPIFLEHLAN